MRVGPACERSHSPPHVTDITEPRLGRVLSWRRRAAAACWAGSGVMADDVARVRRLEAELREAHQEIERRDRALAEALEQQAATSDVLRVIASSPTDLRAVTDAVAENAARL